MQNSAELLDSLDEAGARQALERCCGAQRWVGGMLARRPFANSANLHQAADEVWSELGSEDWLEAFSHHPRIGDRQMAGAAQETRRWSSGEQAGASRASAQVQQALERGNQRYEERFGHVFLICASGRSGEEMLAELKRRLTNEPTQELREAAAEQAKITHLRLDKLAQDGPGESQ